MNMPIELERGVPISPRVAYQRGNYIEVATDTYERIAMHVLWVVDMFVNPEWLEAEVKISGKKRHGKVVGGVVLDKLDSFCAVPVTGPYTEQYALAIGEPLTPPREELKAGLPPFFDLGIVLSGRISRPDAKIIATATLSQST